MTPQPKLSWKKQPTGNDIVLILHGGKQSSTMPVMNSSLSYLRMLDFAHAVKSAASSTGTGVALLRYAVRGWNNPRDPDPVRDARWALAQIRTATPGARIVLLGHSMGGRTAARIVGDDNVLGACMLAPWFPPGEPITQFAGKDLIVAHGTGDRWTSPQASMQFCAAVRRVGGRAARAEVDDGGHFMLRNPLLWRRFAARSSLGLLGAADLPPVIETALTAGADEESLRLPIADAIRR